MLQMLTIIGYYLLAILLTLLNSGNRGGYYVAGYGGGSGDLGTRVFAFALNLVLSLVFTYYYLTVVKKYAA